MEWRLSGFTEVRELGEGAQGRVVLARHAEAGTPVAIKYLPRAASERAREAFRHEARMLGAVRHPNVARLYRLVEKDEGTAIVMEAVDGVSLRTVLDTHGRLEPEAALLVLKGSLLGLSAAHDAGVVHRDYKPANVVVQADGLSKLVDFGVSGLSGEVTRSGTPVYMAPEQWNGDPTAPATDVYAATCVFYECVAGVPPYGGRTRAELAAQHRAAPVPVERMPEPLRSLVEQGMAKSPIERPPTGEQFVAALERTAADAYGDDWERRGLVALAAAASALVAVFPLAAAGLAAPAAAAVGGAGGGAVSAGSAGGLLAGKGTTAAVVGAAVITAASSGVAFYAASGGDDPAPPAVAASPAPVGSPGSTGPVSPPPETLGPDGVGRIRLGMTAAQAMATGLLTLTGDPSSPCAPYELRDRPGSSMILISARRGVAIIAGWDGLRTPEGIGSGSTVAETRRAYPSLEEGPNAWSARIPNNADAFYRIEFQNDRLTDISLQIAGQDCVE